MEEIVIRKQRQMTFAETLEFCLSSIRHRFGRSLLTLCVVILAVAFFMFLQCSNIFRNSVRAGVEKEIIERRKPSKLLGMLYSPCMKNEFIRMLVDSRKDPAGSARIRKVLSLPETEMEDLVRNSLDEFLYLDFFDSLTIGRRKELFGRREGRDRLEFLLDSSVLDRTLKKMRDFGGIRIPGGEEPFRKFLSGYPEHREKVNVSYGRWRVFQQSLQEKGLPQNDMPRLRRFMLELASQPEKLSAWRAKLAAPGFALSDAEVASILRYQDISQKIEEIQELLSRKEYRVKWRRAYGQDQYSRMDEKMEHLDAGKSRAVFRGAVFPGGAKITEADLRDVADEFRTRKKLRDLELQLDINLLKESSGFSPSQIYLMCLSFLVCVVGITNAMLMSITERFREIATLKCLGATDSFILIQIVLEALIQGVIGALAGLLLGFFVALIHTFFQAGFRVFDSFDWSAIAWSALSSLLAGVLLSVLSSLYPSAKAAHMAPMEAMRVE